MAHAGLTLELHFYRNSQGQYYSFYTPLYTNSLSPDAPMGTYLISSPHQPTNGSVRGFSLSTNGLSDIYSADSENFYSDFNSAIYQITNGAWTLLFTNDTTTNIFNFTVSAPTMTSNMLPAALPNFPLPGESILSNETTFSWQTPASWPAPAFGQVYNSSFYYNQSSLPAGQTNWMVDDSLPPDSSYNFSLTSLFTNTLFSISTPIDTNSSQPFPGWSSQAVLESSFYISFGVVATHGTSSHGHTLLTDYTFEDNSLFVHDFSGSGNDTSYAWYTEGAPPTIVTNDAASGTYAGGFGGSGWFTPPDGLTNLFQGSFTVSLWLKTTNVFATDDADQYSSAGIVSALGGDYDRSVAPMMQSGNKLAFYTGGGQPNVLHSRASINTGQYVHVVTTRDQQTGQKNIYINGVLDSTIYASTDPLNGSGPNSVSIGYNNGNVFSGQMDEIQFYAGVLSSNEVAFLHAHPGTNISDTLQLQFPTGRYDFEDTNNAGIDTSGHHNDANCSGSSGTNVDIVTTNAAVGNDARQFFGDSSICFAGGYSPGISNALSGDFTVTAWINTTNSINSDSDNAISGMSVFFAYSEQTNGTIPISITGSKAAFSVYNTNGEDTTIHSTTSVTDGLYHLIAVTRTMTNGLMHLYVDGVLEASGTGSAAPIQTHGTIFIGGGSYGYNGLVDDIRVYGGALPPEDIAALAANGALTFSRALGTSNVIWSTGGDSQWFLETTNTYNGAPAAAQSGSVTNEQSSVLSATVTGPGTLSFVWQNPSMNGLDLEFDIDGDYQNDIGSFTDWTQDGPYQIGPGQHTLTWTAYANDADASDAAFLGQVTFVPASTEGPVPVDMQLRLEFHRNRNGTENGYEYSVFPVITSVFPTPDTSDEVNSPNNSFRGTFNGPFISSSGLYNSIDSLIQECNAGNWSLVINKGAVNEQTFTFTVSVTGLDTNTLPAVTIYGPANGGVNVATNPSFYWSGPANFGSLNVTASTPSQGNIGAFLSVTATNWPTAPTLSYGTNQFFVNYSNNFPTATFSVPVDQNTAQPISNWVASAAVYPAAYSTFVVGAPGPAAVRLTNIVQTGTNIQFFIPSLAGRPHTVQTSTNLILGNWVDVTNFTGDGSLKPFVFPRTNSPRFFRVRTQ